MKMVGARPNPMERSYGLSLTALFLLLVVLGTLQRPVLSIPNRCSACQAVADEIELGLANERPRNHLDLRHRLDSKGQREGKVIDYRVSELRVVELLEGLCSKFKSYTFRKGEGDRGEWVRLDTGSLSDIEKQEAETYSKELTSYCGRLLETTDDELTSKIQKGEVKAGDVESVLCLELSKHCNVPRVRDVKSGERVQADSTGGSDGEL